MSEQAVSELVRAPGRVNLIGDHTDYTGGLVFPMAIDRWTEIEYIEGGSRVELTSTGELDPTSFELPVDGEPAAVAPGWGRYVAAVAAELGSTTGIRGTVSTTIPVGAGLSSSAALEMAAAMALGHRGSPLDLARLGQRAEHRATGVPTGIMDQLCITSAVAGHALLIDCSTFDVTPSPVPDDVVIVVRFVAKRTLEGSEYGERVAQCAAAEDVIGPLCIATLADTLAIDDPIVRARARHVVTENAACPRLRRRARRWRLPDRRRGDDRRPPQSARRLRHVYTRHGHRRRAALRAAPACSAPG